ncbi:hypothetical protein [Yinghuangia sp. YIM S09857]|uniref:hypothetical protein n=1 Tax=Yinghuangia sp. YIM S09857 TaxID=3436929 RepID=UPI003F52B440
MPTVHEVLVYDTAALDATAAAWEKLANAMVGDADRLRTQVIVPLSADNWRGEDANQARSRIRVFGDQFEAIRAEASAAAAILRETIGLVEAAKNDIRLVHTEVASSTFLVVNGDGTISIANDSVDDSSRQAWQGFSDRIQGAVNRAADADAKAALTLNANTDAGPSGDFNASALGAGPVADGVRVSELLSRVDKLNPQELAVLNTLLAENSGNPDFSATMLQRLGPEDLLKATALTSRMAPNPGDKSVSAAARLQQLKSIQTQLGLSPASASERLFHDQAWFNAFKAEGRERIELPGGTSVYGYQVFGVLMRQGTYHPSFLEFTGQDMLRFERENDGSQVWETFAPQLNLNGAPDDAGLDPMTGLFTALSRDPKEANQFVTNLGADDFRYVLYGREPIADTVTPMNGAPPKDFTFASREALGLAIQAGTTGVDPATNAPVQPHTQTQADLMERVVNLYGQPDLSGSMPQEIQDDVAKSLTSYISDVHARLAIQGGNPPAVFPGFEAGAHAVFDARTLTNTIYSASFDPNAAVTLRVAEQAYTGAGLIAYDNKTHQQEVQNVWNQSAKVTGIFNAVQTAAAQDQQAISDAEYNNKVLWQSKYLYHGPGAILNTVPHVGDVLQRSMNLFADSWGEANTRDTAPKVQQEIAARNQQVLTEFGTMYDRWGQQNGIPPAQIVHDKLALEDQLVGNGRDYVDFTRGKQ